MLGDRLRRRLERLLDEAEEAADSKDWIHAKELANEALLIDADNEDAKDFIAFSDRALAAITGGETSIPRKVDAPEPSLSPNDEPSNSNQVSAKPTSFANGRYTVSRFLGEGGKKRVYLAQDNLLDRDVAFALIKTEGLDDVARTRISREAQAMGRLGSHPHIVTVFDLGDHEGQPFMVTELMGGGDVEAIIEDAPDHRLPMEQAIRIAAETCRGLEFAHSRGIIHRDLKPGNVWLTEDGTAKIGDFGLAVATDRSRLTQEGMMVGTVSYMPPEQAMGGETTARADLYSLGAMLYEMVAGRPPFLGDDSVAIIGQHINTPPVAPTWHRSDCPKPLEALILRLLAKNPAERPETASDVLTALEGVDLAVTPISTDSDEAEVNVLDSLAGGVFVGRQAEIGELKAALEDALSGKGRMLTLVGEPGIGKTRTAQELATYASLRGAQVLWGRCYEDRGMPPYWPWVQAIRSYVRDTEPDKLRSEMGAGAADIAEIVSDVREQFPDLPTPPVMEPEQARFKLFDSITTFLKSASQKQPIMLVLDDLHWADKPSLLLLEFVARELSGARLLLVGTYRDMELNRRHPLAQTLGELTRERLFQRVLLRGLSRDDIGRFIEATSGANPPRGLVQAVHTQTEGNPLFVTEVVRLLVQEGELTQERRDTESWNVRIPEGVREVIGRRLDRLTERCNDTLTIASVIGREFGLDQLDRLIEDISQDRLLDVLDEALSARVIEELPSAVGRYQFTHALIQETLSEELSLTRRTRLHARIAESLEELYGAEAEARAAELAHHFAQAESVIGAEKLVHYSLLAGEQALATYAHEEALGHFLRALAAKKGQPMDADTAGLLFGLGCAQGATGQVHDAWSSFQRAFDYYVEVGDTAQTVLVATYPLFYVSGLQNATYLAEQALMLVPPESVEAGRLLSRYGLLLNLETGDYHRAQEAFNHALVIARRESDEALEMRTCGAAADAAWYNLDWPAVFENSIRSIELARRSEDPGTEMWSHFLASVALFGKGDPEGMNFHATTMLEMAESFHNRGLLVNALWLNSILAYNNGEWQASRDFNHQALELSPQSFMPLGYRAQLEYQVGDFEQGKAYIERLLDEMRRTPPGPTAEHSMSAYLIPLIGYITGVSRQFEIAEEAANTVMTSPSATPMMGTFSRVGLALIAVQQGNVAAAEEQYAALESQRGAMLLIGMIMAGRVLGLLAHTMGNFDDAQEHFEDALAFCRKAGYRPELAWSLCDYADMLLERNSEGDRQKAMQHLDESLQISTELGMRPLMERVLSRREILKA